MVNKWFLESGWKMKHWEQWIVLVIPLVQLEWGWQLWPWIQMEVMEPTREKTSYDGQSLQRVCSLHAEMYGTLGSFFTWEIYSYMLVNGERWTCAYSIQPSWTPSTSTKTVLPWYNWGKIPISVLGNHVWTYACLTFQQRHVGKTLVERKHGHVFWVNDAQFYVRRAQNIGRSLEAAPDKVQLHIAFPLVLFLDLSWSWNMSTV